ncbi:nucleotide-diphospho-sugar transferase [Lyophyllum atratum]|nr:nucleotide-diphospho-sugar transferase [Lyophyllum atratum]
MMSSQSVNFRRPRSIVFFCAALLALTFILSRSSRHAKPKGVILMLLPPSRVHQATLALRNVEDRFNRRLKYPYVLFMVEGEYDQVTELQREKIEHITEGRAKFAEVPKSEWDVPESLDSLLVEASLNKIGFSHGYRAMCRWYSGFYWKHPALAQYDWLWRLDTDIEFHCDLPYDPIERLVENDALYGFVQVAYDADWVQPTLASNVSAFMSAVHDGSLSLSFPEEVNHEFVWNGKDGVEKAMSGEAGNREWTKRCMYNNFEISHRSVWESDIYTQLFAFLDRAGGFFYERWSDSPIHSFGIAMSLRKDQVLQFKDMGYQHQGWEYECPAESTRCTCLREKKFENFKDGGIGWFEPDRRS